MHKKRYIGIMSGTSLDGVDAVLCEIDAASCQLLGSLEYPMPLELKSDILMMIEGKTTLEHVGQIDYRLGMLFTQAVETLLIRENIDASTIVAIGSHGQTLWHEPDGKYPFSMQLGDPNILTAKTGIPVVTDFRRKDIALGGQGAPFAPAFHEFIFGNINMAIAIVNIGGMANITVLKHAGNEKIIGYDTGCGNVLLDTWIVEHQGVPYDKDGGWARSGTVDYELLDAMMRDAYFDLPYPKSTGREKFNNDWLKSYLKGKTHTPEDVQRTLLELTALSISNEVLRFNTDMVLLCGGGAKNTFLLERIKALIPNIEVTIAQHSDQMEAMTFAWLAYKRIQREPVDLKDVTGASQNAILGGIYE
ncbi:anhydro-N-acetylmuramic acid kinase [Sulfurovum sp.]|uniref:anhydro-N-acetylmuramic acid kinase n=1 Tax=Sulfurovum sp. TaxID=1969726 RepID=UPI0028680070|nr:anhydro-N-acetylmuramic acid kinase [Sulfurovum sp.]